MTRLRSHLGRFLRDERATVSVDAVMALPFLIFLYAALFIFWDSYRTLMTAQKSTFTLSDIISREPATINQAYLNGMNQMFGFLTGEAGTTSVRVSVVRQILAADGVTQELELRWSHVAGAHFTPHADLSVLGGHVPALGLGDEAIMAETHLTWDPLATMGVLPRDSHALVATSPRFSVPQVLWSNS